MSIPDKGKRKRRFKMLAESGVVVQNRMKEDPMRKSFILPILLAVFILFSCAAVQQQEKPEPLSLLSIEGVVQNVSGKEATLELKLPEAKKTPEEPISEIAQQVLQKSILLEGMKTEVNKNPLIIKEIRGNIIKVEFEKPAVFTPGAVLRLDVPKKTIAIVDFEVIKGHQKEAGRVNLEGLTSALIDSGQFNVVERAKLKTIMSELELSRSGMTKEAAEKTIGKLLFADLLLTGTLAESRGEWDINLRLINTRTGQAVSAISVKTKLFKPSEIRDTGPLAEDFETSQPDPSWVLRRAGKKAHFHTSLDRSTGSEGSQKSIRIDFNLIMGKEPAIARLENKRKRDLSLFDGIEFHARATEGFHGQATFYMSQPDDPNKIDAWTSSFEVDRNWERIRIPFNSLFIGRGWIKRGAARQGAKIGDQVMRLDRVESFFIGINVLQNSDVSGTLWIDKIRFYNN
jgi:TolB-like protein